MKRRLFNMIAATSLLIGVVMAALWVRSYRDVEGFTHRFGGVYVVRGVLIFTHSNHPTAQPGIHRLHRLASATSFSGYTSGPQTIRNISVMGIYVYATKGPAPFYITGANYGLRIRYIVGLACLLPVRCAMMKTPNRQGLCLACGYDLRATPNRCPECGKLQEEAQIQIDPPSDF